MPWNKTNQPLHHMLTQCNHIPIILWHSAITSPSYSDTAQSRPHHTVSQRNHVPIIQWHSAITSPLYSDTVQSPPHHMTPVQSPHMMAQCSHTPPPPYTDTSAISETQCFKRAIYNPSYWNDAITIPTHLSPLQSSKPLQATTTTKTDVLRYFRQCLSN